MLVMCTTGIDAGMVLCFTRFVARRTRVVAIDFITPRESRLAAVFGRYIRRIDAIACIRRGDVSYLQKRFGLEPRQTMFVQFPADPSLGSYPVGDEGYVYSAGWAYRDWPTLLTALDRVPYRAILSPGSPVEVPESAKERVQILPMQRPADGRRYMASARVVVLAFRETQMPSGPLVLLDAMAMGKPVVVTSVNGSRDYVTDGQDALVVPPGDPQALADAIDRAMSDDVLRARIAAGAKARVACMPSLQDSLLAVIRHVTGTAAPAPQTPVNTSNAAN